MLRLDGDVAYQPPLRWWSQLWRYLLCLVWSGFAFSTRFLGEQDQPWVIAADLALGLLAFVAVSFRRRWPMVVALIVIGLGAFSYLATGPAVLAMVSVATRRQWLPILIAGVASVAVAQVHSGVVDTGDLWWVTVLINLTTTAGMIGWGLYLGSRRAWSYALRDRAERAEADRELRVETARDRERTRIAREMHDVLAHRISQVSMHAGALAYRDDLDADELRAGAGRVQLMANAALDDLRGVLGVLRNHDPAPAVAPQPTHHDLSGLVDTARRDGARIDLDDTLDDAGLPAATGRTIYRIVQEALTNAAKHAPGARVRVRLAGDPETGIDLEVSNRTGFGGAGLGGSGFGGVGVPGAGLGLVGVGERVDLAGGRAEHRLVDDRFTLRVWLPWAP